MSSDEFKLLIDNLHVIQALLFFLVVFGGR
jgi:hypothetical protein